MASQPSFFIVWCPTGPTNPSRTFRTRRDAQEAAAAMARKYPGQTFHVLEAADGYRLDDPLRHTEYTDLPF